MRASRQTHPGTDHVLSLALSYQNGAIRCYLSISCSLLLKSLLIFQGQVNRAEVEETTFAIKRELAAIRQHDMDTNHKLEEARERSV